MKARPKRWDVFVCHASEDKNEVATPLALLLRSRNLKVWYDDFSLKLGDDLSRSIDNGLTMSKFGVVVFSPAFLSKEWPRKELDALVILEAHARKKKILPVWHNIDAGTLAKYSPLLAGRKAVLTSTGLDNVADAILDEVSEKVGPRRIIPNDKSDSQVNAGFKDGFLASLASITRFLADKRGQPSNLNSLIDTVIMLLKDRIDKWDIPSVEFGTRELFVSLYKSSEGEALGELYPIFKDLFELAYSSRRHMFGSMLEVFTLLMFRSWVPDHDVEKGEKVSRILLRLALDFVGRDPEVARTCATAIDNLAGDMFEPEILSKEILLGAHVFERAKAAPALKRLASELTEWIETNDQYSRDALIRTYLKDSIDYAEWEESNYGLEIEGFKRERLYPVLLRLIDKEVEGFAEHMIDLQKDLTTAVDEDLSFETEELVSIIGAYEFLRPNIHNEVKERIRTTKDPGLGATFDRMVKGNNFLKSAYGQSRMITTFDELIRFFEENSDLDNLGLGLTTFSLAMVDFIRNLKSEEKEGVKAIARKYGVLEDLDVSESRLVFEIDRLVYLGKDRYDMKKLPSFLREINATLRIRKFSTGVEFQLRRLEE